MVKIKKFLCAVTAAIKRQTIATKVFENISHDVIVWTKTLNCLIAEGLCSWKRSLQHVRNESYSKRIDRNLINFERQGMTYELLL